MVKYVEKEGKGTGNAVGKKFARNLIDAKINRPKLLNFCWILSNACEGFPFGIKDLPTFFASDQAEAFFKVFSISFIFSEFFSSFLAAYRW